MNYGACNRSPSSVTRTQTLDDANSGVLVQRVWRVQLSVMTGFWKGGGL